MGGKRWQVAMEAAPAEGYAKRRRFTLAICVMNHHTEIRPRRLPTVRFLRVQAVLLEAVDGERRRIHIVVGSGTSSEHPAALPQHTLGFSMSSGSITGAFPGRVEKP